MMISTSMLSLLWCPCPFPPGKSLHYYSNHIRTVGWCCCLFYMIVSYWYRLPGTRMIVNEHSWWWCPVAISISRLCQVQWITYCPMGTTRITIIPVHPPLLSRWEPYKCPCPRCRPPSPCRCPSLLLLSSVSAASSSPSWHRDNNISPCPNPHPPSSSSSSSSSPNHHNSPCRRLSLLMSSVLVDVVRLLLILLINIVVSLSSSSPSAATTATAAATGFYCNRHHHSRPPLLCCFCRRFIVVIIVTSTAIATATATAEQQQQQQDPSPSSPFALSTKMIGQSSPQQ